jgi:hypothetical protein
MNDQNQIENTVAAPAADRTLLGSLKRNLVVTLVTALLNPLVRLIAGAIRSRFGGDEPAPAPQPGDALPTSTPSRGSLRRKQRRTNDATPDGAVPVRAYVRRSPAAVRAEQGGLSDD